MVGRALVLGFLTLLPPSLCAQDKEKLTAEELARRQKELFEDAAAAGKKRSEWRAKIKVDDYYISARVLIQTEGFVAVKAVDEKSRRLYWEESIERALDNASKPDWQKVSRTLYKGTEYFHTLEALKIVEKYDLTSFDLFFASMLARDGLTKDLEKHFKIDIVADPNHVCARTEGGPV